MEERYYIPSFKKEEFNSIYIKSIVYFVSIFISPLFIMGFYYIINKITNNTILTTFYKENSIIVMALVSVIFLILFIVSRIKFINYMTTAYLVKDDKIIKGKLNIKKINVNKKGIIGKFLFSSFVFEKRYNLDYLNVDETKINYLTQSIIDNTDYSYVVNNFASDLYDKEIYENSFIDSKNNSQIGYKNKDKKVVVSSLYTDDMLYLDYSHYYGNKGTIVSGIKRTIIVMFYVALICSVDLLINYSFKYLDKINATFKNFDYRLVDYGYNLRDKDTFNYSYEKDSSKINISLNKVGKVVNVDTSINLSDFNDIATARYIMSDIVRCDSLEIDKYITRLYDCLEDKCSTNDFDSKCGEYKFTIASSKDGYNIVGIKE